MSYSRPDVSYSRSTLGDSRSTLGDSRSSLGDSWPTLGSGRSPVVVGVSHSKQRYPPGRERAAAARCGLAPVVTRPRRPHPCMVRLLEPSPPARAIYMHHRCTRLSTTCDRTHRCKLIFIEELAPVGMSAQNQMAAVCHTIVLACLVTALVNTGETQAAIYRAPRVMPVVASQIGEICPYITPERPFDTGT